jgi:DNA-binding SARP family transcriptional activator
MVKANPKSELTGAGRPLYDPTRYVSRRTLLETIAQKWDASKKALLIEAQAGQGKTTLAMQLLAESNSSAAWHQFGSADGDPVLFLATLNGLFRQYPGFSSPLIDTMLEKGEVDSSGVVGALDLLLKGLKRALVQDVYLVLDDLYLLEGFPHTLGLLGQLLQFAPSKLKLILISRRPILPLLQSSCTPEQVLQVSNVDLALTRNEVASLFNTVLHLPITTDAVQTLHRVTEGWVMGMLLVASKAEADGMVVNSDGLSAILTMGKEAIPEYFIAEVLDNFPLPLRRTLTKLALLQEVPLSLAQRLAEVDDIVTVLNDLQNRNFFVRNLDADPSLFAFHHLFQDCLRSVLERDFSAAEIRQTQIDIATWYLAAGEYEKAFDFYVIAHDFVAAELILRDFGMTLHTQNRIVSLQSSLAQVSDAVMIEHPWFAYYKGIVVVNVDPPAALAWFERARAGFCSSTDDLGELMSLLQIIHFHMAIDSRYNLGRIHLQRASDLLAITSARLTLAQKANAANTLLLGYALFDNDIVKADQFYGIGLNEVLALDQKNLETETRLARFYRNIFLGDHPGCRQEIEQALELLASPRVNVINKAMLLLGHLNLLVNEADHDSYPYRKALYRKMLGEELFDKSILGAFVSLWDIDMYFAQGEMTLAREEIQKALQGTFAGASAHLRSQYLQYHAYMLAFDKQDEQALVVADESMALRAEVGCPFYEAFNAALIGTAYAQLGKFDQAEELFAQGLSRSDVHGAFYARPTLLAHRTYWRLIAQSKEPCQDALRELFAELRSKGFRQLWLCTPQLMTTLMSEAVRCGIETDYVRTLAAERYAIGILADGTLIPLLKMYTLGRIELELDGRTIAREVDLTANLRQLLVLLLTAPGQQLHQEIIQENLWPNVSAGKARGSFDNLVFRLRKTFAALLGEQAVSNYLSMQKGVLRLDNCQIDFVDFAFQAKKGLTHLRKKEFWQADNAMRKALHIWQGELFPGAALNDISEQRRQDLLLLFLEVTQGWAQTLAVGGRASEAVEICRTALKYEPTHAELNRSLYNLYVNSGEIVQARKTLEAYEAALRGHGFSRGEIAAILNDFWDAPN